MTPPTLDAYIIHKRPYRETSFLVDALTEQWGKVSFVAKGAQQKKSRLRAQLQLFQPLQIQLLGKSNLKNLIGCETSGMASPLSGTSLYCGLYLNELLSRILEPEMPVDNLYGIYHQSLYQLASSDTPEPILRQFELSMLTALGYGFSLDADIDGNPIVPQQAYVWHEHQGLVPVINQKNSIPGQWLLDIAGQRWHTDACKAAKFICRQALKPLLGDKPLKSRELFRE